MRDVTKQMRDLGRRQAKAMRDNARAAAIKRKEEYLGARVPRELREKVIARANSLGIPVSILIRNILEEAFSGRSAGMMDDDHPSPVSDSGTARAERFPGVIGWERITLNRAMDCTGCGRPLSAGSSVTLGLPAPGEDHVILCNRCKGSV